MYRWLVKKLTKAVLARLRAGDPRWILSGVADDVHFRFLGEHSWTADFHSKAQMRAWLKRYLRVGLQLTPHEIAVSGPPWNTVVLIRFTDVATDRAGNVIYENEGVLFERLVWGRIREHISYEDTQRTAQFDKQLAALEGGRAAPEASSVTQTPPPAPAAARRSS
jgi:ketosteroid isomerase-like protein